jgi:hypothetical protein
MVIYGDLMEKKYGKNDENMVIELTQIWMSWDLCGYIADFWRDVGANKLVNYIWYSWRYKPTNKTVGPSTCS